MIYVKFRKHGDDFTPAAELKTVSIGKTATEALQKLLTYVLNSDGWNKEAGNLELFKDETEEEWT